MDYNRVLPKSNSSLKLPWSSHNKMPCNIRVSSLRYLLPGNSYTLDLHASTLPTKVRLVKGMVFPVIMYGCESWTVKKAEGRGIDAFKLWCWRRLLRVSWTARRSNQSILKEISPGIYLEGMMLKLKLQYFGHLIRRVDLLEKTLMLGGIGGRRRRGRQRMRWLDGITESEWTPGVGEGQGGLACCDSWGRKELDTTEWLIWSDRVISRITCNLYSIST